MPGDFEYGAGTEVVYGAHFAQFAAIRPQRAQADKIGTIELVSFRSGKVRARNEQLHLLQAACGVSIGDAAQPRDEMTCALSSSFTQLLDFKFRRAVLAFERRIIPDRHGIGGKRSELHLAVQPVGRPNLGDADARQFL